MKVAIVTAFPSDPEFPHGGVEAVSVNLVRALARVDGVEVHVLTSDRKISEAKISPWQGATIHRLPAGKKKVLSHAVGEGRRQVQAYLNRLAPDVVHAHDTYGLMVKGMPIPRVFTIHGFIHEDTRYASGRFSWLRSQLWKWIEVGSWAEQPHIVAISPYVRERLNGISTGVIHDIENPISEHFFHLQRRPAPGTIFSAAMISRRKNTTRLVESFQMLLKSKIQAQLRLAGKIEDPDYGQNLQRFIEQSQLSSQVLMLGQLSGQKIQDELTTASVFALVSLEEGAPMGVAEAMAVGVPVVTSNRCGMPYMVRHGETGFLVNPNDTANISQKLYELLSSPQLQERMQNKARQVAQELFHPDKVAARTLEVYRQAMRNGQALQPAAH